MGKKITKLATKNWMKAGLFNFIRVYSKTFKLVVENENLWLNEHLIRDGGKVLLCTYHQQFFSAINYFRQYAPHHPAIMISQSKDGEIISGVAERCGWRTIRGSSSKGGKAALKEIIRHMKSSSLAAHIVDGPRGPATIVKPGVIYMSKFTGAAIVPFYVVADKAWYFNSWDHFFIPKPFSKVTLQFGKIIFPKPTEQQDDLEIERKALENQMADEYAQLQKKNPAIKNK